jgi:hypothetical protein
MIPNRIPALAALAAAALLPLAAQTPLFNDGTAVGGSKVFSEGISPLGNPARYDQAPSGLHFSYVTGDARSQDNSSILQATTSSDPASATSALTQLQDAPWALRTKAYGFVDAKNATNWGFTREEFHSELAYPDLAPVDLTSYVNLGNNATYIDGRRAIVDRLHYGGGALASGTAFGYSLRLERWEMGQITPYLNQPLGTYTYAPEGLFPFSPVDGQVMGYNSTSVKTLSWALDLGFTTELAPGLRLGGMVDQLNKKRLWDVDMRPQYRAALQLDLGPNTQLTAEGDINAVERMPFPVSQQSASASLRYLVSPTVAIILGGERRKIADAAVTRGGATLQIRTPGFLVSFGIQVGQDRPLTGYDVMVN